MWSRAWRGSGQNVSASDRDLLKNLERNLKLVIFGQNQAIETPGLGHQDGAFGPGRSA